MNERQTWLDLGRMAIGIAGVAMILASAACDRERPSANKADSANRQSGEALAATTGLTRQAPPYTARSLDAYGRVVGSIEIDGDAPLDSVVQPPPSDQPYCGGTFIRRGIERRGTRAIGVVVWLNGLRSGKPLPVERRFEIVNDRCLLVPEVQAAVAGGTLNVRNVDATEHRTRLTRRDGGAVLATIRETDEGQVVPNERVLARPGVLELSCDLHAWTHAWISVFDHPYFTTTGADGAFSIDSVPPGRHQVRAWHPRLGMVEDSVTIEAGQTASINLRAKAN